MPVEDPRIVVAIEIRALRATIEGYKLSNPLIELFILGQLDKAEEMVADGAYEQARGAFTGLYAGIEAAGPRLLI